MIANYAICELVMKKVKFDVWKMKNDSFSIKAIKEVLKKNSATWPELNHLRAVQGRFPDDGIILQL